MKISSRIPTLAVCLAMLCAWPAASQVTSRHMQAAKANHVVLRDLELRNDPEFIPGGHRSANVTKFRTPTQKKNWAPRLEYPVQATIVEPNAHSDRNRNQFYEFPCVSFMGMRHGSFIPPDVAGAVGYDHIILTENDSFRVMEKDGNNVFQQLHQDGAGLWAGLYNKNLFDPKMIYDPFNQRWIHVILADSDTTTSSILIAVSDSPDPLGGWGLWEIDVDDENDQWFDYPSVGFNNKWLVINGKMFPVTGTSAPAESRTFIFGLNELLYTSNVGITIVTHGDYSHIIPALMYDINHPDIWCVTNDDVDDNDLRFFKISGPTNDPVMSTEGFISISPDWGRGGTDIAPQLGSSLAINAGDHRLLGVVWRNGILFTVQTIFLPEGNSPNTCTIQYVACDPGTETVHEAIRFASDATSMYAFPCIAVNANQDIVISCSRFTSTTYPSATVLVRRNGSSDWTQTTFKSGEDWYVNYDSNMPARNRWGDYNMAYVDPSDDQSIWVISEYSRPRNGMIGRWGTWIAKICSDICDFTVHVNASPPAHAMKKYEAFDTVFASATIPGNASVKLDAGYRIVLQPNFKATIGTSFKAFIEGCTGPQ